MFIHVKDGNTGYDTMVAIDMIATVEKRGFDGAYTLITMKDGRMFSTLDSIKTINARIELAGEKAQ